MTVERMTTKNAIVCSFKELMQTKTIEQISVKDICENCKINRQSFYYYFKDKYDVAIYIFRHSQSETIRESLKEHTWGETIVAAALAVFENKTFYINALKSTDINSLSNYLFDYASQIVRSIILSQTDDDALGELKECILQEYMFGLVGLLKEWYLIDGMKRSPELISMAIVSCIPNCFKQYFDNVDPDMIVFPE